MKLPFISAQSQSAVIGIRSDPGKFSIHQGTARLQIKSPPATVHINTEAPVVIVDNSRLRAAMNGGSMQEMNQRIYSQLPDIAKQAIRNNNAKWEHVANLHDGDSNPIATIARERLFQENPKIQITAPPSSDNVSFEAVLTQPEIQITPEDVEVDAIINRPVIDYQRGNLQTYLKQRPTIEFSVMNLDMRV